MSDEEDVGDGKKKSGGDSVKCEKKKAAKNVYEKSVETRDEMKASGNEKMAEVSSTEVGMTAVMVGDQVASVSRSRSDRVVSVPRGRCDRVTSVPRGRTAAPPPPSPRVSILPSATGQQLTVSDNTSEYAEIIDMPTRL